MPVVPLLSDLLSGQISALKGNIDVESLALSPEEVKESKLGILIPEELFGLSGKRSIGMNDVSVEIFKSKEGTYVSYGNLKCPDHTVIETKTISYAESDTEAENVSRSATRKEAYLNQRNPYMPSMVEGKIKIHNDSVSSVLYTRAGVFGTADKNSIVVLAPRIKNSVRRLPLLLNANIYYMSGKYRSIAASNRMVFNNRCKNVPKNIGAINCDAPDSQVKMCWGSSKSLVNGHFNRDIFISHTWDSRAACPSCYSAISAYNTGELSFWLETPALDSFTMDFLPLYTVEAIVNKTDLVEAFMQDAELYNVMMRGCTSDYVLTSLACSEDIRGIFMWPIIKTFKSGDFSKGLYDTIETILKDRDMTWMTKATHLSKFPEYTEIFTNILYNHYMRLLITSAAFFMV